MIDEYIQVMKEYNQNDDKNLFNRIFSFNYRTFSFYHRNNTTATVNTEKLKHRSIALVHISL